MRDTRPAPPSGPVFVSSPGGARWRRRFAVLSVGLVGLLTAAGVLAYGLSRAAPAWWESAGWIEPGAGRRLQNSVISQLHLSRATAGDLASGEAWRSEPWRVSVRAEDINAWIVEQLPGWLANRNPPVRWPARLESVRVAFEPGRAAVGAQVAHGGGTSVIAVELAPALEDDGSLWLRAEGVRIGRLPAPSAWVMPRLQSVVRGAEAQDGPGAAEWFVRVLAGEAPLASPVVIALEDGRRVRVLGLEVVEGAVWITAQTERGP